MEIQKSSAPLVTSFDPRNLSRLLSQLQSGYTLDAVVTAKLAENSFILKLSGGQLLRAQTLNVLEPGQILKLEVVKAGTVPELKIMAPAPAVAPPEQQAVTQALRQFLPKQQSLIEVTASLRQIATLTTGKSDVVSAAVHEMLGALLSKDELMSTDGLKRGLSNSGLFLEAKLANLLPNLQGDLKGRLLTLADTLQKNQPPLHTAPPGIETAQPLADQTVLPKTPAHQNIPSNADALHPAKEQTSDPAAVKISSNSSLAEVTDKTLLTQTEGAIARIVLDQLASLPQNNDKQNVWQIEIPFTNGPYTDSVKLKINREGKSNKPSQAGDQTNWSVMLELNPPGLGTLHSRINLVGETIDTYFWSDQPTITALVREHLDLLSSRYAQAGLAVGQLNALEGTPVQAKAPDELLRTHLLDEHI